MKFKNINIFNFLRGKKIPAVFLTAIALFVAPFVAKASFFEWVSGKAIGGAFFILNSILGYIAGIIFNLGGALVNFALQLNSKILDTTQNTFMSTGWNIILGFADLALILAIIVIAFATILRIESYGMKKTLWRLIVAALLVNFSLVIAGVFIDTAGIVTDFFVGKSTGMSPENMATILASAFDVQKMIQVDPGKFNSNPLESFGAALLIAISSTLFILIFTIIAAIILFAIFIMFLARYVVLSVLLIFSPLVLVAWIFPATQGLYKQWWQKFMQWTFFAPVCTFFLYLSVVALQKTGNNPAHLFGSSKLTQDALSSLGTPLLQAIGQMVMAVGLLMASLMVAQKFGIAGSQTFYGWAQGAAKGVGRGIQRGAWRGATRFTGAKVPKELTAKMAASRLAPVRWAARGLGVLGTKAETEATKQYKEQAKGYTPDRLNNEILASRGVRRNVLLEHAAKNKNIQDKTMAQLLTDPDTMESMEKQFKTQGLDFKSVTKATGYDAKTLKAAHSGDEEVMLAAAKEFHSSLKPDDYKNWQGQVIYAKEKDIEELGLRQDLVKNLRIATAHGIGQVSPGIMYKLFPNMKTGEITTFIDSMYDEAMKDKNFPADLKNKEERIKWIEENTEIGKSLKKSKAQRLYGETKEEKIEKKEEAPKKEKDKT
ncbi:hypothetical protein HZB05_02900 [Candidatus Wolfebacteria bacterium]|nr:hypothetical protein [Candidatus Wolfebacteria bacterium]